MFSMLLPHEQLALSLFLTAHYRTCWGQKGLAVRVFLLIVVLFDLCC